MKTINTGIKKMKFIDNVSKAIIKGGAKMIRKYLIVGVTLLTFLCSVLPAQAYTVLPTGSTGVTITATGTIGGNVVAMTGTVVDQGTADLNPTTAITFPTPNATLTSSNRAIKLTAGTNQVGARIIIYTDNASYFPRKEQGVDPRYLYDNSTTPPTVLAASGVDGSGLVGQTISGYVAGLVLGIADAPGSNAAAYSAWGYAAGSLTKATWLVDKGHEASFTAIGSDIDKMAMYKPGSAVNENAALSRRSDADAWKTDGLYPQLWDVDLWDKPNVDPASPPVDAKIVSQALYKNIATIAYSFGPGYKIDDTTDYSNNYVCSVKTSAGADLVIPLSKLVPAGTDKYLYINIGGVFAGLPAQTYTTAKLQVMFVID